MPKLAAYEAYLKGKYHQARVTPESLELARQIYEQASKLDPAFAMPHVGLAFYWHCLDGKTPYVRMWRTESSGPSPFHA